MPVTTGFDYWGDGRTSRVIRNNTRDAGVRQFDYWSDGRTIRNMALAVPWNLAMTGADGVQTSGSWASGRVLRFLHWSNGRTITHFYHPAAAEFGDKVRGFDYWGAGQTTTQFRLFEWDMPITLGFTGAAGAQSSGTWIAALLSQFLAFDGANGTQSLGTPIADILNQAFAFAGADGHQLSGLWDSHLVNLDLAFLGADGAQGSGIWRAWKRVASPYVEIVWGEPTSGARDGVLVSQSTGKDPLLSGWMRPYLLEEGIWRKCAIRCSQEPLCAASRLTVFLTGASQSFWRMAPDVNGSVGTPGDWGQSLTLTNIDDTNKVFWVQAKAGWSDFVAKRKTDPRVDLWVVGQVTEVNS